MTEHGYLRTRRAQRRINENEMTRWDGKEKTEQGLDCRADAKGEKNLVHVVLI